MKNRSLTPYFFDFYEDFIHAIEETMKEHHNSKVPAWRIIESTHYCARSEWQERRQNYLDIKSILDSGVLRE